MIWIIFIALTVISFIVSKNVEAKFKKYAKIATNGHMTIIHRALRLFDHVVVAVARNGLKNPLFTMDERQELLKELPA